MALIDKLNAIGSAIREKNGTTDLIPLADMPQAILDIVSGGGVSYESIVFENEYYENEDTITLTDKDGNPHTIEYQYTDGKITSVKYDGKEIALVYDVDELTTIGKTQITTRVIDFTLQINSIFEKIFSDSDSSFQTVDELRENYPELIVFYNATNSTVDCLVAHTDGTQNIGLFNYSDEFVTVPGVFRIKNVAVDSNELKDILNSIINSENKFAYYSGQAYMSGYSKMFINCESSRINNIELKPADLAIIEF